jgi:tRNA pseudouridine32 synthase/23S rRNA pseudouridine746 synthase
MGWPILGDPIYGHGRREGAPPLHLHARSIVIPMQNSKPPVCAQAPPTQHMLAALAACGWTDAACVELAPDLPKESEALNIS